MIHPDWIKEWKKKNEYDKITKQLNNYIIEKKELNLQQYNNNINNIIIKKNNTIKNSDFISIKNNFIKEEELDYFVDIDTFQKLKVEKEEYEEIKYILKNKMIIFFFEEDIIIKLLIHSLSLNNKKDDLINLKFKFYTEDMYKKFYEYFIKTDGRNILNYLISFNIFNIAKYQHIEGNNKELIFELFNEGKYIHISYKIPNKNNNSKESAIKPPKEINFELAKRPSYRGLDNVGGTNLLNAILQCLANIKPITDYLLNPVKYTRLYENNNLCLITLEYTQILIGLFCNENNTGSYCPKNFKNRISEYNPIFKTEKNMDSNYIIIILLEILNTELVNVHNKKKVNNNENNENKNFETISISREHVVFNEFSIDFRNKFCSVVGNNLYGFGKNIFVCQNCHSKDFNYNTFNLLIFDLKAISKFFNLINNNGMIPNITFDHCFKFLTKETKQDFYCKICKKSTSSIYKQTFFYLPDYLIIILDRGIKHIFNCNIQIQESFSPSFYVENEKNLQFNLIGIVSHLGENSTGKHFIAFCKHNKDDKWRCYDDNIVTECQNDYLKKGIPYLLFYKKQNENNNQNIKNNQLNNNNQIYQQPNKLFQPVPKYQQPKLNIYNNNQNNINNMNMNQQSINTNFQQQAMNINNNNNIFGQQNINLNNNNFQQLPHNINYNNFVQGGNFNLNNNNFQQQNNNINYNNLFYQLNNQNMFMNRTNFHQ